MDISLFFGEVLTLARMDWALIYRHNGDFANFLPARPQSAGWGRGSRPSVAVWPMCQVWSTPTSRGSPQEADKSIL